MALCESQQDSTTTRAAEWPSTQTEALLPAKRCLNGSPFLYVLVAVASIGGFLFGYDTGVVSGALLLIRATKQAGGLAEGPGPLDHLEQETIVSSTIACCIVGSLCSGQLSQGCGRRPVLILASLVFTAGALLMALAPDFSCLVAGRCVVGIAIGLASSVVPIYLAELAPPRLRGLLVSVNNLSCVSGQVVAGLVDGGFSTTFGGWRFMLGLGGVPSLLQLLGLVVLPESPRWLLSRGKQQRAREVLLKVRQTAATDRESLGASVDEEIQTIVSAIEEEAEAQRLGRLAQARAQTHPAATCDGGGGAAAGGGELQPPTPQTPQTQTPTTPQTQTQTPQTPQTPPQTPPQTLAERWELLKHTAGELYKVRRQLRLGCGLMVLQQLCGINTIMYYSSTILLQAHIGTKEQAIWLSAPVACAQLVGCVIGLLFIDRVGRRPLILLSLAGICVSLAFEGATFALSCACNGEPWHCRVPSEDAGDVAPNASATPPPPPPHPPPSPPLEPFALQPMCGATGWLSLLGMVAYLMMFGIGTSAVPWTVNAEIYPMPVRSLCNGLAVACNWISNLIVAYTFLSLEDAISSAGTFWLYGGFSLLGLVWLACAMPETANKSLEEVQRLFEEK